ncbi:MAG: hypothetical protein F6J90_05310 [Moorea sp. SIOASIH]|uniref:hypothetical protein n=1 Tax=Moorena sp. SIOASIH TaxID=2607817 RepID=UPI0013BBE72B|nr:hypothetical protein [Moorena sp. SIOASIH]NEO35771.1 hypothetical protein [Moorena sp. SIOASIH]
MRLRHKINGEDNFGVQSQKDVLEIVNTFTGALTLMLAALMLAAIAGISLLVGGISVINMMLT